MSFLLPNPEEFVFVLPKGEGAGALFVPKGELTAGAAVEPGKPVEGCCCCCWVPPKGDGLDEGAAPKGDGLDAAGGAPNGDEAEAAWPNPDDCGCDMPPKGDGLEVGAGCPNPADCGCCWLVLPKGG